MIDAEPPALKQMIDVYDRVQGPVLCVERVPREEISSYGVIAYEPDASLPTGVFRVTDLVEKPPVEQAPSDLAIIGRYILTPDIFASLEETAKDRTGEIQLTNGLRHLLRSRPIYACVVDGVRHDTGNKLGFLKAVTYFALKRPDIAGPFSEYLRACLEVGELDLRLRFGRAKARPLSARSLFGSAVGAGVVDVDRWRRCLAAVRLAGILSVLLSDRSPFDRPCSACLARLCPDRLASPDPSARSR